MIDFNLHSDFCTNWSSYDLRHLISSFFLSLCLYSIHAFGRSSQAHSIIIQYLFPVRFSHFVQQFTFSQFSSSAYLTAPFGPEEKYCRLGGAWLRVCFYPSHVGIANVGAEGPRSIRGWAKPCFRKC
jgi:hypothetical protein